jgi:glycosyltransferase involved in cell wall biosynthesis
LVPCKDHVALAKAILRLHENPELRKVLGAAARKTVEDTFDVKMMVRNNENLYQRLMPMLQVAA